MNLFGLNIDSKIEDVLIDLDCSNRLWNILMHRINHHYDDSKIITMRDLLNMPKEDILKIRNLGSKTADEIKSIFKYCGINDNKDWKSLGKNN